MGQQLKQMHVGITIAMVGDVITAFMPSLSDKLRKLEDKILFFSTVVHQTGCREIVMFIIML